MTASDYLAMSFLVELLSNRHHVRLHLLDSCRGRVVRSTVAVGRTSLLHMICSLFEGYAPFLSLLESTEIHWTPTVTGRTFNSFVHDHRLTRAVPLPPPTDNPVTMIALEVGYQSRSHICGEFTWRHGTVPSRVRRG